jgi:hypothetical protein
VTLPRATSWTQAAVDLTVLLGCWGLLLCYFPPSLLLLDTITTGGDTGSHFITADHLARHLLPQGRVVGWFPGNLAGFPLFQFYFPLPFLVMAGLSYLGLPLTIAFKLVSAAGAFIIPPAAYLGLRLAGRPFPAPALAAAFSLLFLCNETNSMWGGNLPSLLAGEIGYSLGLGLLMVYLGAVQGDIDQRRHPVRAALLLALAGLAHGCTLLFAVLAGVVWLFHRDLVRRGVHLLKIYALAFYLLGFWIVPLILFAGYNTTHNMVWIIDKWQEALPPLLIPLMVICLAHLVWGVTRWRRGRPGLGAAAQHLGWIVLSLVLFLVAFHLNVIDIRFLPLAWLALVPWAALAGADLSRALAGRVLLPLLGLALCLLWVAHGVEYIPKWVEWNYRGYELARGWPDFQRLNAYLRGGVGDPRVLHEHADSLQSLGTTRAFENLMLFSGRAGMEGLYIQSSLNSPFIYYLQSQTSQTPTTPLPGINYSRFDLAAAHSRMVLYNVGQFVAVTEATRQAAEATPGYRLETRIGPFAVFRVEGNPDRYVTPVAYQPVLVLGEDWKQKAFQWFRRTDLAVPLVFQDRERPGDRQRFAAVVRELPDELPRVALPPAPEVRETIGPDRIEIQTPGRGPLLIKVSYHPNWRVEGAEQVHLAAPALMLVYPSADRVVLTYGQTWPNYLGQTLTALAGLGLLLCLSGLAGLPLAGKFRGLVLRPLEAATAGLEAALARPLAWLGRHALAAALTGCLVLAGLLGLYLHLGGKVDAGIALQRGLERFHAQDYAGAEPWFRHAATRWPYSPVVDQALHHWALCYYLRQQYPEALAIHRHLLDAYPEAPAAPEASYHIGHGQRALGRLDQARRTYRQVVEKFPASAWAGHARERLRELAREDQ